MRANLRARHDGVNLPKVIVAGRHRGLTDIFPAYQDTFGLAGETHSEWSLKRLAAYRGLFATDLDAELLREIQASTRGGYAIGGSRLREEIEQALKQRATPRERGRPAR